MSHTTPQTSHKIVMKLKLLIPALLSAMALSSHAAFVILSSDFTGVQRNSSTGVASGFSWDTVAAIDAPATSLTFVEGGGSTTVGFFNVNDEIAVNRNMTAGGWDTSITFQLNSSTSTLSLSQLVLDIRLTTGTGADNTTGSKQGRMAVQLFGSNSGLLGTVDPGDLSYPSVEHTRTLDLSGFDALDDSETYTLMIQARGSGFGHNKSLQGLQLTAIPEPTTALLGGLGLLALLRRRR